VPADCTATGAKAASDPIRIDAVTSVNAALRALKSLIKVLTSESNGADANVAWVSELGVESIIDGLRSLEVKVMFITFYRLAAQQHAVKLFNTQSL
jgi:hypothetical protein